MIYIKEYNVLISEPIQIKELSPECKNHLCSTLDKGEIFFKVPDDFVGKNENKNKNTYKVGFLFDALTEVYPTLDKTKKYEIIKNQYHFFITIRQFRNIINDYVSEKRKFYKNRSLL